MSLVSSSDHWFFIASTGGLTAGRVNADSALFPYETEDKITAHSELNGGKTIIRVNRDGRTFLWEPFSGRYAGVYHCERKLYKNQYGNKLIFEETNHDLQLTLRIAWSTGDRFGFIRSCWLRNHDDSDCQVELLDGLQNILPYGATSALQTSYSSLVNAYKRNELDPQTGIAIYALSATLTDRTEASESLKATVTWQVGLEDPVHLLSSQQVHAFRLGRAIEPEHDVCGRPGAYLVNASFELSKGQSRDWRVIADVNQDNADIVNLKHLFRLEKDSILSVIDEDIDCGTDKLVSYVAAADGIQLTTDELTTSHHFANVLFNVMRGYSQSPIINRLCGLVCCFTAKPIDSRPACACV